MLIWSEEVIKNGNRCVKCGLNFQSENGEATGIVMLRNRRGYCKNCGAHVCDDKIVKPEGGKEIHERK